MNNTTIARLFNELKEDSAIDKHRLDEEACKQTYLYTKWASRLAHAEENFRRVELQLTQYKARTLTKEKEHRKTDTAAQAAYRSTIDYTTLNQKKNRLQRTVDLLKHATYAMQHRRAMIEALVKLKSAGYYNT